MECVSVSKLNELNELYRQGGMPSTHIMFATDCMGGAFCFPVSIEKTIYHYDPEFGELADLQVSFSSLIDSYCVAVGLKHSNRD